MRFEHDSWALILGGSSGFGLAAAQKLARHGMSVAIVHRDRRGSMRSIEPEFEKIRELGVGFASFNVDALSDDGRKTVLDTLADQMEGGRIRLLMHSIAFGNLKLLAPLHPDVEQHAENARQKLADQLGVSRDKLMEAVSKVFPDERDSDALSELAPAPEYSKMLLGDRDFAQTIYNMGTNLSTWVQDVFTREFFDKDARVIGMTSEGNEVAWRGYAGVAAAKVAMESVSRAIAVEFAPYGVRSNIVQAGVTDTKALKMIPGSAQLKSGARLKNPFGRLTTPTDVADVIYLLCTDEAQWINGVILRVDGGERIAG